MKLLFIIVALIISMAARSQVTKVSLQASGLTCSMCSNAINKALKSLDFVQTVEADIKTYTFQISFKPNSRVDFDKIRKKVEGAGFFVSEFVAYVNFERVQIADNQPVTVFNNTFVFVNPKAQELYGINKLKIVNKGFTGSNETTFPASSGSTYHVAL